MKEIFLAFIITVFSDHSSIQKQIMFYSMKDCQMYLTIVNKQNKIGDMNMTIDSRLVWKFKKVIYIQTRCENSHFKINEK